MIFLELGPVVLYGKSHDDGDVEAHEACRIVRIRVTRKDLEDICRFLPPWRKTARPTLLPCSTCY